MSTTQYEQAIAAARSVIAQVRDDQLDQPTPCRSWNVSALLGHMIGGQNFFASAMAGQPPAEQAWAEGDRVATFDLEAKRAVAAFSEDGAMERMVELPFGTFPGQVFLGIAALDTFTHAWDLARAIGASTDLDPELATALKAQAMIGDAMRGDEPMPFAKATTAPAGATAADQLAAHLGRTV